MIKPLFLSLFLLAYSFGVAQVSFGVGPQIIFGALKNGAAGGGVSAEATVKIFPEGAVRFYTAFTRIPDKNTMPKSKIDFIPARIGYQQFLLKRFLLFGDAGMGTFFFPTYHFTNFSFGVGSGYNVPLAKNDVRFSVQYDYTRDNLKSYFAWYSFRIAYGFNLKFRQQ